MPSITQNAIFSSSELKVILGKDASESCDHGCLLHMHENLVLEFFLLTVDPLQDGHHGIGDKLLWAFSSRQQHSEKLTRIRGTFMVLLMYSLLGFR